MSFVTINFVYTIVYGVLIPPSVLVLLFWVCFLLNRIIHFYSLYKKEVSNWKYIPLEFDINVFNCKVKLVICTFLLLLIFTEGLCIIFYCLGILAANYELHSFSESGLTQFPLDIELNCSAYGLEIWAFEIAYPLVAFFTRLGDITMYFTCILMVALLKFIFIAYQCKTNFKSVKVFLIKASLFLPILLTISVIPQTQVLSKIFTPLFGVLLIYLLFKHRRRFYLILKWRCDDAFILRDNSAYFHHSLIRRNSTISFNLFILSYVIFIISVTLDKLIALTEMLFTDESRYVTAMFNWNFNLAFLSCEHQYIIYKTCDILNLIQPAILFVVALTYLLPFYGITIWLCVSYLYRQCKGVDSRYIRFKGNADLFHPLRS